MSTTPKIEVISNLCILGEGPHWNEETQDLLYVDIPGKAVHRYDPKTEEDFELVIGKEQLKN
jgi:sugar lactone lactonase YvrE